MKSQPSRVRGAADDKAPAANRLFDPIIQFHTQRAAAAASAARGRTSRVRHWSSTDALPPPPPAAAAAAVAWLARTQTPAATVAQV